VTALLLIAGNFGCSASAQFRVSVLQREKQPGEESAQVLTDQRLLEVCAGDAACAKAALVEQGVAPDEALRRVLAAKQAAEAGRARREEEKR
jgi:hypothetical protein